MKHYILHLILLFINVFSQLKSEMTIQEMNASEDGKNMTVLASDPSNGMTIVRFWNIILHAISTSKQTSNYLYNIHSWQKFKIVLVRKPERKLYSFHSKNGRKFYYSQKLGFDKFFAWKEYNFLPGFLTNTILNFCQECVLFYMGLCEKIKENMDLSPIRQNFGYFYFLLS